MAAKKSQTVAMMLDASELGELNESLRTRAHARLDEQIDMAQTRKEFGVVGVECVLEGGRITIVRRRSEGTDKHA